MSGVNFIPSPWGTREVKRLWTWCKTCNSRQPRMKQESRRLQRWECQSHIASAQKTIEIHIQDRGQSITDSEQFWRTSMSKKSKCCKSYKKKGKACKKCPLFR